MAVGKVQSNAWTAQYYLFELVSQRWIRYGDYTIHGNLPLTLRTPGLGYVTQLSAGTATYDYVNDEGHKNIGAWIDQAAQRVGG